MIRPHQPPFDPLAKLPIAKDMVRRLLPHTGEMCLLDTVDEWSDTQIRCTTNTHRNAQHPLRNQSNASEHLAAVHLVEYAAQAMAIHATLLAYRHKQRAAQSTNVMAAVEATSVQVRPGRIGALHSVKLHVATLEALTDLLMVEAHCRLANGDGLIYDFVVKHREQVLCEGRIIIALSAALNAATSSA